MEGQNREITNPKIYAAITGVIADVGSVAKDKVNKQQGFKYRSIDDVFNALHPALAKNRVFIVPKILNRTSEVVGKTKTGTDMVKVVCDIEFSFFTDDGSHIEAVIVGEGLDTGDKGTNKAMAIAYKYACFQVFCIPTEEMSDPDAERPEMDGENQKSSGKSKGSGAKSTAGKTADKKKEEQPSKADAGKVTADMVNTIREEQKRTGVQEKAILTRLHTSAKKIEDLTVVEFNQVMKIFEATKDLKREK